MNVSPRASPWWLYAFVIVQCVSVACLSVEALGGIRILLRIVPFGLSIAYLALLPPSGFRYPVQPWAATGLGIMAIGLAHPQTNSLLSGAAQLGLSLAVWAPVFWAGRIAITPDVFRRMLLVLWAYNTLSAGVGVLQVYDPARFAPNPEFVKQMSGSGADGLKIRLDDGTELFRPMGLSDSPGGAALAANAAVVMGVGVAVASRSSLLRVAVVGSAVVGMFCLYLCQVRSLLILTVISTLSMAGLMAYRGQVGRSTAVVGVVVGALLGGFLWATSVGEGVVVRRLETLTEGSAGEVYYSNRGVFVEHTLYHALPEYPLGAGLGRWGMMYVYFGDPTNVDSPPLWAEITFTGWVYDGGLPLVVVGYGAMVVALRLAMRVAITSPSQLCSDLAAVVVAVSAGAFATTISAHVFVAQSGMMYLLLNAALFAATRHEPGERMVG